MLHFGLKDDDILLFAHENILSPTKNDFHNSFLAGSNYCHLLITFANSLDPDQDQQNVGPYLDPNCFTL